MNRVKRYFRLAKEVAVRDDCRHYRLGAVGIRSDGAIVTSCNIPSRAFVRQAHAEARLIRKLDVGSEVFIVRILRDGRLATARPCRQCQLIMRQRGVRRCYYSIDEKAYGTLTWERQC